MKQLTFRSASALAAVAVSALALIPMAGARIDRQSTAAATAVQVKGGEFFFRLSTKSAAKPAKVTFVFTTSATSCTTSRSTARRRR